ncbi:alpha-(1,4)-fucosyltransferase [Cryptomeria japonica]|uniref:alpha-(1,4)-fucosyltransferase n=1 Tax=Cryptomeria japonica TaxID=3369 RepID=UPI0027D9E72F|nr:alpha-(1,4)-fucosyltransferase [Cryptomeria japonica]
MLLYSKTLVKSMYYCFAMVTLFLMLLILFGFVELPISSYALEPTKTHGDYDESASFLEEPFTELSSAFRKWDGQVGCKNYREKVMRFLPTNNNTSLQDPDGIPCNALKMKHVSILVEGWTWIPDGLDNLYPCRCGLSCLWTKSKVLADQPEARLFETTTPPPTRHKGEPLRVYMDLEAGRRSTSSADVFVSYHAGDDIQATYAGALFHNSRNYYVSPSKNNDTLVYWSSSRCLKDRNQLAGKLLSLLSHHSFGKCLNNVGGRDMALKMYPECRSSGSGSHSWSDHLHCAMSHYKFVLAIENTMTESYVTEKLFYALDVGAVPIYFGAPNVLDFVPPKSIIDGSKFSSLESLASYVKRVANDPVAYAEYHAWRRCGVLGNYHRTRAVSLDSFPCRLCGLISKLGGKYANS